MFRKREDELASYIETLKVRLDGALERIAMLECPHERTKFVEELKEAGFTIFGMVYSAFRLPGYTEVCAACGKTLRTFKTEAEYLEARAARDAARAEELKRMDADEA